MADVRPGWRSLLTMYLGDSYRREMARLRVVAWLCVWAMQRAAVAAGNAETPEVDRLISQGLEFRRQSHPELALPIFQEAYEIEQTPRTEGHLGLVLATLDHFLEAEQHITSALASPANGWVVKNRSILRDTLAKVRTHLADITIEASPEGASVVVAAHPAGTAPLRDPVRVLADDVDVQVSAPGYVTVSRSVHVTGGEHGHLTVNLEKAQASPDFAVVPSFGLTSAGEKTTDAIGPTLTISGPGAEREEPKAGQPGGISGLRIAAWASAAVALGGTGAGIGFQVTALNLASDLNAKCSGPEADPVYCSDRRDQWNSARKWSIVGYTSGGALAVASGILFWASRPRPARGNVNGSLSCTPRLTGILCAGMF